MNNLLQLKGAFTQVESSNKIGASVISLDKFVTIDHLLSLQKDLINISDFWREEKLKITPLVSAYYIDIVSKSNRIKGILGLSTKKNNESVVGVKFSSDGQKHIITHCISQKIIIDAIKNLDTVITIVKDNFGDRLTGKEIYEINNKKYEHLFSRNRENGISRTRFVNTVVDAYYLEKFGVERDVSNLEENAIITIYDTGTKTVDIMNQLGIEIFFNKIIDETTILLTPEQYNLLKLKAPYLISMAVSDIALLEEEEIEQGKDYTITIPKPSNEPTIGVIDTMFDENVYFSEWVEFKKVIDDDIPLSADDYTHGTCVTSIIVDGARINPELDDGCGRFKVRHFGVATGKRFSSFTILKAIKEIVVSNSDIKVWNLSLGSAMEINPNFISPEAAVLDQIQFENNVIFVIAGTNKSRNSNIKKIGSPADSINSLVVNSVGFDGEPAEYSREGVVLSFFNKPDLSYYGGDRGKGIRVCSPTGETLVAGTSFAAPWISRKIAYLIEVLGLTREIAKALLIDSAISWENKSYNPQLMGYGVVPININDIINTPDDEIKFILSGTSEKYNTYNYNIPVPVYKDRQPFVSKAVLCYFPNCSRNQGVDYTNTELSINFGRLKSNGEDKIIIDSINKSSYNKYFMNENSSRIDHRKWDNVKHIVEYIKTSKGRQKGARKHTGLWGISLKTTERLNTGDGKNLEFGVVVTLKEVNGVNRLHEFMQQCMARGWLVYKVVAENRLEIYNKSQEQIQF